jgi:hypothetical protein
MSHKAASGITFRRFTAFFVFCIRLYSFHTIDGSLSPTSTSEQGSANGTCGCSFSGVASNPTDDSAFHCTASDVSTSGIRCNAFSATENRAADSACYGPFASVTGNRTNNSTLRHTFHCIPPDLLTAAGLCSYRKRHDRRDRERNDDNVRGNFNGFAAA